MRRLTSVKRSTAGTLLAILVLTGAATALSACNTMAGFGQDMRDAGSAVANSADRLKNGD